MRLLNVLMIILTGLVTQSCKIEMPSLIELIGNYDTFPYKKILGKPYDLRKSNALAEQGGFKDTLIIGDNTGSEHETIMVKIMNAMGVSETHIVLFEGFQYTIREGNVGLNKLTSGEHETLLKATRIVHLPLSSPFTRTQDVPRVAEENILFVLAAGNWHPAWGSVHNGNRDEYNINHPSHSSNLRKEFYKNTLNIHNTGKVVAVTSAEVTESGEVEPFNIVAMCGDIKESCFTVIPAQSTSAASARLSAMAFYLAQFWETPEEIIEVLSKCAVDVGETGVDREYGQGVANLLCPEVLKKEVEVVSERLGDTEEQGETLQGGEIAGTWTADSTALQVYIPKALKETLQAEYQGTVNGTLTFEESRMIADASIEATVSVMFLQENPIKAKAEDTMQFEKAYTVDQEKIVVGEQSFIYTATEDSLHVVRTFSLNEVLALLPELLGSMVDMASPDFFVDDPIQIRMSFSKEKSSLVGDFNEDGTVDTADFLLFVNAFGSTRGEAQFDENLDIVPDGIINIADFLLFIDQFGKTIDG